MLHFIPFYNYDKISMLHIALFLKIGKNLLNLTLKIFWLPMWTAYRMYNTMLYMSLFWGFAKKSEAKVILHSSAMLKKIKGPFNLINFWMKILNSILEPSGLHCLYKREHSLHSKRSSILRDESTLNQNRSEVPSIILL